MISWLLLSFICMTVGTIFDTYKDMTFSPIRFYNTPINVTRSYSAPVFYIPRTPLTVIPTIYVNDGIIKDKNPYFSINYIDKYTFQRGFSIYTYIQCIENIPLYTDTKLILFIGSTVIKQYIPNLPGNTYNILKSTINIISIDSKSALLNIHIGRYSEIVKVDPIDLNTVGTALYFNRQRATAKCMGYIQIET